MAARYPFIIVKGIDGFKKQATGALSQTRTELKDGVDKVVDVVYRTARAKRPMVNLVRIGGRDEVYPGRKIPKDLREGFYTRRVSDPNAKFGVAVRTGALQASIQKESHYSGPFEVKGKVWTNIKYAGYIEFGTSKMAARPFMRPAYDMNKELIKKYLGVYKETGASVADQPINASD